ncbi:conjugative transfer protein MobI(A/C) [Halomonas sp. 86]|uniref:conjugative transfer protein MobI(A/C) n=1 Tax=unclassified Halomonas TaxID=2609666 RepID=UPI00403369E9
MAVDLEVHARLSCVSLERVKAELESELVRIQEHAQMICDLHWENLDDEKRDRSFKYITRIRTSKGSLQCQWMKAGSRPPAEGRKFQATYIRKGTARNNPRYKTSAFNKAEQWEREIIDETENNYALLRERYALVCRCIAEIDKITSLAGQAFERVGIPWETQLQSSVD